MNKILSSAKNSIMAASFSKSLLESMLKLDFKIGDRRENFMQLCFSSLAMWPLLASVVLINFFPMNEVFSLVKWFGEDSRIVHFLLDGHFENMLLVFGTLFVLEWILRLESFFILLILFLLKRFEIHLNLAFAGVAAITLSRICYMWWLSIDSQSETKLIWNRVHQLQFAVFVLVFGGFLYYLDYAQVNYLFDENTLLSRLNFMACFLAAMYFLNFIFLATWGHFYFQGEIEPGFIPVHYSTAHWILRFGLSRKFIFTLKTEIEMQTEKHRANIRQFIELKNLSPGLANFSLGKILQKEIEFLKEARLRIERI